MAFVCKFQLNDFHMLKRGYHDAYACVPCHPFAAEGVFSLFQIFVCIANPLASAQATLWPRKANSAQRLISCLVAVQPFCCCLAFGTYTNLWLLLSDFWLWPDRFTFQPVDVLPAYLDNHPQKAVTFAYFLHSKNRKYPHNANGGRMLQSDVPD